MMLGHPLLYSFLCGSARRAPSQKMCTRERLANHKPCWRAPRSGKYFDDSYEYRHVSLPPEVAARLGKGRLLSEPEWRALGVQQSRGWVHYRYLNPKPSPGESNKMVHI